MNRKDDIQLKGQKQELKEQIEIKRAELVKLAELYGFGEIKVIEKSQELDQLLNIYSFR